MLPTIFILLSVTMGVVGQLFIKRGLNSLGSVDYASGLIGAYIRIFLTPYVVAGLSIYFLGVFFWLYALSKVDLSFAYPFVSLSYVLVLLISWVILGEHITGLRWAGVGLICAGVFIVSRS